MTPQQGRIRGAIEALAGRRIVAPSRRGLVSSGRRINLDRTVKARKVKAAKWQDAAWGYNDEIGFVKSTNNQVADASARVRTYPAISPDPGLDPIPIDEAVGEVEGVTQSFADACQAVYSRIRNETGTIRELQRRAILNLNVPGDCVLIGEEREDSSETWELHSSSAIDLRGDRWYVRTGPNDRQGRELDPERTNLIHIMRPHGQWPDIPDSNMRGLLGACELLSFLTRGDLAVAQSRIANAGLLFVSNDLEVPGLSASDYDGDSDVFTEWMGELMMQAIEDPASASAVVPGIVRADGTAAENIQQIKFDRPMTEETLKKVDATILYIARGLYAPPEWTLGIGESSTYATARVVDREGYLRYLDPTMLEWCGGLTTGWLRPALGDMQFTPQNSRVEDVCIWRDPASILARAEPTVAKDKGTDLLLAQVAEINEIRAEYGWEPIDGMDRMLTPEEVERLRPKGGPPGMPPGGDTEADPNGDQAIEASAVLAITASASDRVAQRLGHADRVLFDRLLALADKAIGNALNVASSRLRTQASHSPFKDLVKGGIPSHLVAQTLGRGKIEVLTNGEPGRLFDDTLDRYRDDFDAIVRRAQDSTRLAALSLADDDWDDAPVREQQDTDRSAAWLIFTAALTALAADRLLNPTAAEPPNGEYDPTLSVPGGVVRQTVAAAGGQPGLIATPQGGLTTIAGEPAPSVGTGPTMRDLLRDAAGLVFQGYVWVYSGSARPWEPHEELADVFFETFHDDVLSADPGSWPHVERNYPGDHAGCGCSISPARLVEVA